MGAQAQTALADQPPLSSYSVPGNLALVLSVEYPTAVSVAYASRTYVVASQYLGYFDPAKCYVYVYNSADTPSNPNVANPSSYFAPNGLATSGHLCNVNSTPTNRTSQWSGNFLNWATAHTIDTFRGVLTGGYRVVDTQSVTVLEKAWATGQGGSGEFPDSSLAPADVPGATPFAQGATGMTVRIQGLGNVMRFAVGSTPIYSVNYYNSTNMTGTPIGPDKVTDMSAIRDNTSPRAGVAASNFSAVYTTTIVAPTTGAYTIQLGADDTASLYLNGSSTATVSATYYTGAQTAVVNLTAGQSIPVTLTYAQYGGSAYLYLNWMAPGSSQYTAFGVTPNADLNGPSSSDFTSAASVAATTAYNLFTRAKVCDTTSGVALESNCTAYGSYAKPEGLLQKYSKKLRYSTFGYLNDSNILRDGGVLRAQQKFIGPLVPTYGLPDATNTANEWDPANGILVRNPDSADAAATNVSDSGVMNYINKFGEMYHSYKGFDPVSELYYAAIRYYKAVGNVPEWSNFTGNQADGFPVITNWNDPIAPNWCQRNFILGIGDVNTHADKNVTGATPTANEPAKPALVIADTNSARSPTDAVTATNQVGIMESGGTFKTLGTVNPYNGCCDNNSALMVGLAYDSHTTDIRNDITKPAGAKATVDTYWVDVQEGQRYKTSNQFWGAAKYGGFTVPAGFSPYTATSIPDSSWWNGVDTDASSGQKRANNYYPGSRPDLMQSGLITAFADIASKSVATSSTSFLTSLPQVGASGTGSYAATYDPSNWGGDLVGSSLALSSGAPVTTPGGDFAKNLALQTPANRRIATWNPATGTGVQFEATVMGAGATALSSAQLAALDTSYVSGNDSANDLLYLRGDRSQEQTAVGDATHPYRYRASLLGDIVNSKPTAVGVPSFPYADASNPGYSSFKSAQASRPTVVYVGANDGMLHAVDGALAAPTSSNPGNELFAYVPNALFQGPNGTPSVDGLASLGNPSFVHHYMVDATAYNYDIDFRRTTDGSTAPPTSWTPDWHSVLIGGLGKGGKAFYALDITDPNSMAGSETTLATKVLWEFSNANYLGYTFGEPLVVKTKKYGWVVVLPSGYNNGDGVGHLLLLNPKTGTLLETVTMPAGSAGLAHVNAWIIDGTDGTADALYAGDLNGNVWRVDVTAAYTTAGATYPSPLLLAKLTSPSQSGTITDPTVAGQPITTRLTIAVDPSTGRRYAMVGTGRLLDATDIGTSSSQGQSFYGLLDGTNGAFSNPAATGVTFPINRAQLSNDTASLAGVGTPPAAITAAGWYVDLSAAAAGPPLRVLSDATTSYGAVSFVGTQPGVSACAPGGIGQVYALNFGTAKTILINNSGTLLPYLAPGVNVTEAKFVSQSGTQTLLYGANGSAVQAGIVPNAGTATRRVNWREVPTAD